MALIALAAVLLAAAPRLATAPEPVASVSALPSQPAPAPPRVPEPGRTDARNCDGSLQAMVDAAAPGSVVEVPGGCVYRETVTVSKPITLRAGPGAEIRGSDVWERWSKRGSYWVGDRLPPFYAHGTCEAGGQSCTWPEQVFVGGRPLEQVAAGPRSGQFAVDGSRRVVLADDPSGRIVEVTVRRQWVAGRSENVTVEGFAMRHAANDSQRFGAITNNGHPGWTVRGNVLSDAHGAVVSLTGGEDLRLSDNDISRGGQLGLHASGGALLVRGNRVHHNNTEGFSAGWEAGGVKTSGMRSLTVRDNEVYANNGPGLWCDGGCRDAVYSGNRVHHNSGSGVLFETGSGAVISGNTVWENGWGFPVWGWGGGIVSSSSRDVEVRGNVLAWNADGISVISADRAGTAHDAVTGVRVRGNSVLAEDHIEGADAFALCWLQDWAGPMFEEASGNAGEGNRYWYGEPEGRYARFKWGKQQTRLLDEFNATPGEEGARYMTDAGKDRLVSSAGIPAGPEQWAGRR